MWKVVETKTGEIGVAKTKGERGKRGSRKEERRSRKTKEKKTEEGKNNGSKEGSGRMGDL